MDCLQTRSDVSYIDRAVNPFEVPVLVVLLFIPPQGVGKAGAPGKARRETEGMRNSDNGRRKPYSAPDPRGHSAGNPGKLHVWKIRRFFKPR